MNTALFARRAALCVLAATPLLSQATGSALDHVLSRSLGGASAGPAAGGKLHESSAGYWMLQQDPAMPGRACAITFHAKQEKGSVLGFLGPTDASDVGAILFVGPKVPKAAATRQTSVRLDTTGDPSQTVRATHLRHTADLSVLAVATNMKATISALDDAEVVSIHMDGTPVFQLDYQGGHAARDALLKCMAARASGK